MAKKHLSIEIADHRIGFTTFLEERITSSKTITLEEDETNRLSKLEEDIEKDGLLNVDYDTISIAYANKKSTIVPSSVFSETTPDAIFKLCFGKNDNVDYNRISEYNFVNVYTIPFWIKQFFIRKSPLIKIQHEGTHLIREALKKDAFYTKVQIHLQKKFFLLMIVKENKLNYYSFFDYNNVDDIIYHTFFVLKQKELEEDKGRILVSKGVDGSDEMIPEVIEKLEKIGDMTNFKKETLKDISAKSQLLCV